MTTPITKRKPWSATALPSPLVLRASILLAFLVCLFETSAIIISSQTSRILARNTESSVLSATASPTAPKPAIPASCGSAPEEAQRLGCQFDILSFAWQSPGCYDADSIREFEAYKTWNYFPGRDESTTERIPHDELGLDVRPVHVDWDFHRVHCFFVRRQLMRAFFTRAPMDSHLAAYGHTTHCAWAMLEYEPPEDLGNLGTLAPVIYPECKAFQAWMD